MQGLSLYISAITNSTGLQNTSNVLSAEVIDDLLDSLSGLNLTISANTSFLTVQNPQIEDDITVLGASFKRGIGGEIIDTTNQDNITRTFVSAAGMVTKSSLNGVISLNLFIVDKPTGYENADNSSNKILASSVVVASIQRNTSAYAPITILLYFNPLAEYKRIGSGTYFCSFYDTNLSQWSESGCSEAYYNTNYHRYECNCSHLTSFALVWLPQSLTSSSSNGSYPPSIYAFDPQDIASLVFQCLSIICFLAIMTHAIAIRFFDTSYQVPTLKLLPLVSTASTTILFLFFISLGATVRIQTRSPSESQCFLSSHVLMFITYFCLIFMFCAKTSTGYFYYLRFVRLFPQTSHRQLFSMLTISFLISLTCVLLAIGLNTNSSITITRLYPYKFCWFSRDVIYYFVTIPVGVFLLVNIVTITLIARSIITHAFHAGTREQMSERLKRCVLVLLSSCVTQGLGWFFGPFITFANPSAGSILAWFFILVNGLEGFWSIMLYTLIRLQHIHEEKRVVSPIGRTISVRRCSSLEKKTSLPKVVQVYAWDLFNQSSEGEVDVDLTDEPQVLE